ncbi:MAG: prenyltransferase/squalene oxidase repeat-containing protein [Planctomycetota bacterium]|jgi:squalene-hopene/tetraprenyl-beta-curcumene cyclase|nr:prenyltransferase/squalene oxidase repeat-containing protein [Planctomycetota bacterium]MDP6761648.1 prenyltransferase/squalene oxidase repeat-containing protein [Planctomycetota bacterium]MDP6989992.1 prenyltransferase/squalene oxidase repeat-containing protein [Planctomycetota bacterium]
MHAFIATSALLVPAALPAPTAAPGPLLQEVGLDLKGDLDRSVRWLRSKQAADGRYGAGVTETAWVLHALAVCPRAYRRHHGPFVSGALDFLAARQGEDGSIADAAARDLGRLEQSALAHLALSSFPDERSAAVLKRLTAWFETTPPRAPRPSPLARDDARKLALSWLARRRDDGSWEGVDGAVLETSRAVIELSRAYSALKPAASEPSPARRLPPFDEAERSAVLDALRRGALFLVATSEGGLWGPPGEAEAGMSAMALGALQALPPPRPAAVQEAIDDGLDWLASLQKPDGSIHDGKLANYITSASILALVGSERAEFSAPIARARGFLVALQADEGEGYSEGDLYYGGIGYGNDERPDLSNLQMALEALSAAGLEQGDETFRKALRFLERTQNRSESNDLSLREGDQVVVRSGDDGGAAYSPGESPAGHATLPDGTRHPRSYGSMTYALLKGFVFAGLEKEDPRMQAAWEWIREHYTLDVNPGFEHAEDPRAAYQGLFYYFHTMARALDLFGEEVVVDPEGVAHPWRRQLCGRLLAMQRPDDGSWVNENAPRWWEGNPVLATSYAMLTLSHAMPTGEDEGR